MEYSSMIQRFDAEIDQLAMANSVCCMVMC